MMKRILYGMWIPFITIRSNMGYANRWRNGLIRRFTAMLRQVSVRLIGGGVEAGMGEAFGE